MATAGYRVIERGLRPDGTPRKPLKVKEGYQPPDETEAYVPPHKAALADTGSLMREQDQFETKPMLGYRDSEQPKTKSQIKNEKKHKNKKEKKLQDMESQKFPKEREPPQLEENSLVDTNGIVDESEVPLESAKLSQNTFQTTPTSLDVKSKPIDIPIINETTTDKSQRAKAKKNRGKKDSSSQRSEISEEELVSQILELEKQEKKFRKKLEQIEKLLNKEQALSSEEQLKVGKKQEWEQEMKTIEKQLRALKTK